MTAFACQTKFNGSSSSVQVSPLADEHATLMTRFLVSEVSTLSVAEDVHAPLNEYEHVAVDTWRFVRTLTIADVRPEAYTTLAYPVSKR